MTTVHDVRVKVARAKKHFADLNAEIIAYRGREPYAHVIEVDPQTKSKIKRFRLREPFPPVMGAIIGDCVHNLRSSLDLLANALVLHNGGTPTKDTHFPIRASPSQLAGDAPNILRGASLGAIEIVKRLQTHKDGENPLMGLHLLDIADKHRLLVPVAVAETGVRLTINFPVMFGPDAVEKFGNVKFPEPTFMLKKARYDALKDGDVLSYGVFDPTKDHAKMEPTIQEAFGDVEPFTGKPVVPAIKELIDLVEGAVEIFATEVFKP
jgi:hypothetical protein